MKTDTPRPIHLKDYEPSAYLIDTVGLDVSLAPRRTRVKSKLAMRPNPAAAKGVHALQLDGESLELAAIRLDGRTLSAADYALTEDSLTIERPPQKPFTLEIETTCDPEANTSLSGLYLSRGIYCTQCEAEGFRRITYYLDQSRVLY